MGTRSTSAMTFRLEPELRQAFVAACEARDRSAAQELRAFMRSYVERHAQGELPLVSDPRGPRPKGRAGRGE